MKRDEVKTRHPASHVMPLDQGLKSYWMFKEQGGCVRGEFSSGRLKHRQANGPADPRLRAELSDGRRRR
jgi:hypothetical protein